MALQDTDLLPLYRVSDSTNRKISVADLLSGAAGVWTEDSGKLYPNTLSNNVQIGGTAADPNITLNANGLGEFKGGVKVTGGTSFAIESTNTAPIFLKGSTYIGGTTARNTFELWKSTLTEEQLETLEAGTLVAPANVSLPGDGSFVRQWYYDQQDAETQAELDAGTLEYPEHLAAATFTDTFALGDNTNINLLSTGEACFASKVGIGTTDPKGLIHFEKNGIVESWYSSTETGGATWRVGTAGTASGLNGAYRIYDQTNSASRFVINSSGNVGIDTDSPGRTLHVNSTFFNTARFQSSQGNSRIEFQDADTSNFDSVSIGSDGDDFLINTGNGDRRVTVKDDGKVGIGTTDPKKKLEVTDDILIPSGNAYLTNAYYDGAWKFLDVSRPSGYINMATTSNRFAIGYADPGENPVERISIIDNGNVGIGTDSPGAKLHVESAATTAGWQVLTDSVGLSNQSGFYRDASDNYELTIRNGEGGLSFIKNDGGASTANLLVNVQGSERLRIDSAGQIGLGGANYGTAGQVITSNGSSTAPTWQDASSGGAWNLLSTIPASGASTVDFTSNIDSTYRTYVIIGSEVMSSVDADLNLQFYVNDTLNTSNDYDYNHARLEGATLISNRADSQVAASLTKGSNAGIGRVPNMVEIVIDNPSVAKKQYKGRYTVEADRGDRLARFMGVLAMARTSDYTNVNGVRLYPGSGTVSGTFKLYGIT